MSSESQSIQTLLSRYKRSMPEKAEIVSKHLDMLFDNDGVSSEVMDEIRENLHKLAGSSGMYGYDDLAEITRNAMQTADKRNVTGLQQELMVIRNLLRQYAKS